MSGPVIGGNVDEPAPVEQTDRGLTVHVSREQAAAPAFGMDDALQLVVTDREQVAASIDCMIGRAVELDRTHPDDFDDVLDRHGLLGTASPDAQRAWTGPGVPQPVDIDATRGLVSLPGPVGSTFELPLPDTIGDDRVARWRGPEWLVERHRDDRGPGYGRVLVVTTWPVGRLIDTEQARGLGLALLAACGTEPTSSKAGPL